MSKNIIVVDDETHLLSNINITLKKQGFEVTTVERAPEALEKVVTAYSGGQPYDLLITDLQMPGMNGLELIDEVNKAGASLPTIAITGYGDKETVVELMRRGCADYLDKPFGTGDLLERVQLIIGSPEETPYNGGDKPAPSAPIAETSGITVTGDNDWKTIQPAGDMDSAIADELRLVLVDLLDSGHLNYRFDLANVKKIHTLSLTVFLCFGRMLEESSPESQLEIVNANGELAAMFKTTGIGDLCKVSAMGRN